MPGKSSEWQNLTSTSSGMSGSPLYISFLWHMHQPYYKDPFTGLYRLPWVRLHGTKDYLDMVRILRDYPDIRQNFNLVPSLLEQIIDYTENNARDVFLDLTLKDASELTDEEKVFLLENFFLANWDTMIRPIPRYNELLMKRGLRVSRTELKRRIKYYSSSDFLDLQVLFNLVWIDPVLRKKDPFLNHLIEKGKDYTEEEKKNLVLKQQEILKMIIPEYREIAEKGQIELSTTPFYHPILPLICDTNMARISSPEIRLPRRFSFPEDSRAQIREGIEFFEDIFGFRPSGMWPSEGSVSEDVVKMMHSEGLKWIATDEEILARSLGIVLRGHSGALLHPEILYSVYEYEGVNIIFRDHKLSDLIGFVYSRWEPKSAAEDLINRLNQIHSSLPDRGPYLVPIILDGENAWEYYKNDGHDFLNYLYEGLSESESLQTITISEYLKIKNRAGSLHGIYPGSWINGNFNIWIGHEEDNTAWNYLLETRQSLETYRRLNPQRDLSAIFKNLYIAEGSDWNWWYGDEHSTENAKDFDELFRLNLMKVYREIGIDIPSFLYVPVLKEDRATEPSLGIRGFIFPKIDGIMTSYFEWYQAAYIDVGRTGGSMHSSESLITRIYYGFNQDTLFIRIDPSVPFVDFPESTAITIETIKPHAFKIYIPLGKEGAALFRKDEEGWKKVREIEDCAVNDIVECAISFNDLLLKEREEMNFFVTVIKNGEEMERCPWRGYISIIVPTPDFEAMMWY